MAHVKRIVRFSTGTVDIHPQHAYRGHSPMYWWILTSRRWLTGRPINVYVIEHADGVVVFDTGQTDSVSVGLLPQRGRPVITSGWPFQSTAAKPHGWARRLFAPPA